jgi:membrane protease YdiL (CAAX protease family)
MVNASEQKKTIWLVVIYSLLVNGIAWTAPLLGGSPSSMGPGFILWGSAPLLVSLLMRAAPRDWSDLGLKPAIGKNIHWYVISFLALPALMVMTLLVDILLSIASVAGFLPGKFLQTMFMALPVFFIFAIFEEVGWRGYLSPKLASLGLNRYLAAVLVGVVWASWHLPYIRELTWVYSSENLATFIPRFYLVCIALSLVLGGIRNISETFWPAVLMHAVINSFVHPLSADYVTFVAGTEYLGSISTGLFYIVFVILLGWVIARWGTEKAALSKLF